MQGNWPRQRFRTTSLAGSIAVHALVLLAFLAYRQQLPAPQKTQPPLDVVFLPAPLDPQPPKLESSVGGDREPAFAIPLRSDPIPHIAPTPLSPAPSPLVTNAVPPAAVAPIAERFSGASGVVDNGEAGGTGVGTSGSEPSAEAPPSWIRQATTQDWANYFPRSARSVTGRMEVVLSCLVTPGTRVHSCQLIEERPRHFGIGNAVLAMSRVFRVRPPIVDGRPRYDVRVRIRMVLTVPETPVNLSNPFSG